MVRTRLAMLLAAAAVAGCAAAAVPSARPSPVGQPSTSTPATTSPAPATTTPAPSLDEAGAWAADLAALDQGVRAQHPNPFANHPESEWTTTLSALPADLAGTTPEQQLVRLSRLVGLLDTHSSISPPYDVHAYDVLPYPFADGWFVTTAKDPSLVGSRLVSISGTSAADIDAALRPLIQSDNESGDLDGIQGPMVFVEWLTGLGIVKDAMKPAFVFERPDGSQTTVDLTSTLEPSWEEQFGILGDLNGSPPRLSRAAARPPGRALTSPARRSSSATTTTRACCFPRRSRR